MVTLLCGGTVLSKCDDNRFIAAALQLPRRFLLSGRPTR
jgi:hypothetical protein